MTYQVCQDVVVALCILSLFNNLEDKNRGENKMPAIQKQKVGLCACVYTTERDILTVSQQVQCRVLDLVQDGQKKRRFTRSQRKGTLNMQYN